jgi:hypothetical protein
MLRAHLLYPFGECRDNSVTASHSTRIRLQRLVLSKTVETKRSRTCVPLTVTSYSDDERTVGCIEQLVRNQIGVSISPSRCIPARNENVLCDVHKRCPSAVR